MTHIDSERMASFAMSDDEPDAAETAHLAECHVCAAELDAFARAGQLARDARGTELVAPPAEVWTRIQAELGLGLGAPLAVVSPAAAPVATPAADDAPDDDRSAAPILAPVRPIRGLRRARFWVPLAAAALVVGLVGGVGVGVWWQSAQQSDAAPIAAADLEPFPEWPAASGSAVVEQRADGTRQVVVDVDPATDAGTPDAPLREVWLIRTDGTGLISIGFLDGTSGRFDIPTGVDLAQYALVDVSAEPDNGDPTHSGDSIVRGELRSL